ncbi:hypothetical protein [Janthinobacterium sp. HLX7-2]|uniref:hypothetical protein n=1 Tax=Janthinobacterium sp. HLX7-2 TaxID=1259331 RepID=UPI003F25F267
MLTATYSLVSLSVEQASIRLSLLAFQKYMHVQLRHQSCLSLAQLEYAGDWLSRLYQGGYWRKVEMYLIPAIREATPLADGLLDELNGLHHAALESVHAVQQRAGAAIDSSGLQAEQLCAAIDAFCAALLERMEKEERELFALARKVIVGEAWFAIAYQFLAHDAQAREARHGKAQVHTFILPAHDTLAGSEESAGTGSAFAQRVTAQPLRAKA